MRTTLTIDPDVAVQLERLRRERDASLRDVVNDTLRRGLQDIGAPKHRKPFRTKTFDGARPLFPSITSPKQSHWPKAKTTSDPCRH